MIKCSECGHKLYKENKYMSWLSLMNFVDFLLMEEYINQETAESMQDKLMNFKKYALDESDIN